MLLYCIAHVPVVVLTTTCIPLRQLCPPRLRLQELEPLALEIEDDSEGEESKFSIFVVSKGFEGSNTLKRHRTIYNILDEEMKVVHAMSMVTKTPEEAGL